MRCHRVFSTMLMGWSVIGLAATAQPRAAPNPAETPAGPAVREAIGPSDTAVEVEIESRLFEAFDNPTLRANVIDGVATLTGDVRSESERLRAADIARDVMGVAEVLNELVVDATAADDAPIERDVATLEGAVAAQLRGDPVLGTRDIQVIADRRSNTVTLVGNVGSAAEKERATRIAGAAYAAGHIRNRLEVRAQ